jgi:hypothetical protein
LELLSSYFVAGSTLAPFLTAEYPRDGNCPAFVKVPAINGIYISHSEQEYI